jgi:hypothetical protein
MVWFLLALLISGSACYEFRFNLSFVSSRDSNQIWIRSRMMAFVVIRLLASRVLGLLSSAEAQLYLYGAMGKNPQAQSLVFEAEFDQHLLRIGLISSLPDPALDIDDDDPDDQPVTIKGEPLSETIIRERR